MTDKNYPYIQSFIDYLKFEKRYSAHTIRSYHDDLVQFFYFLDTQFGKLTLKEISSSFVRSWLASLKDNEFDANNEGHRMIRMYAGLEDADYLIEDLQRGFKKMEHHKKA